MSRDKFKAKSMLEKMGFVDEDLRCPDHDEMSLALMDPVFATKLIRTFPEWTNSEVEFTELEYPLSKGSDQYSSVVGYIDAKLHLKDTHEFIFVEAKPRVPNPMETLRQVNTYNKILEDACFHSYYGRSKRICNRNDSWIIWAPGVSNEVRRALSQAGNVCIFTIDELREC